ncbi:pyocin knob domain-containing protein, partial [Schinkia azotoformans]|nr:pyocin knob domain-containing protein [Schinkia azotoformans]
TAVATQSVNGLMSSTDKKKLDGVQAGAQVNTVDSVNGKTGAVNLSADDVGAIPKTGGTLTGPINIPSIFLGDSSIYLYEEGGNFGLRVGKSPNYSFFAVSPSDMWFGGNKIWHAGNDGVGSGLDADTLDGKHWTDILFQFGGALNTAGGLLDWNAHTVPGTAPVLLMGNAANGPGPASYFHVQNYEYGNKRDGTGQITQVAIPYASPTTGKFDFYVRGRYSGVWSAWQKIGGGEMYTKPRASSIYLDTTVANQYYTLANITGGGKFTNLIGHSYLSSSRYGASQFKARFTVDGVVNDVNIQSAHAGHDNIVALGIYSEFNFNTSLKVEVASEWVYGLGAQAHYTLK